MAKQLLGGGAKGKPLSVDLGSPQKRFYLGHDRVEAERRKAKLIELWRRIIAHGQQEWNEFTLEIADAVRKGQTIIEMDRGDSDPVDYRFGIDGWNRDFAGIVSFVPTDQAAFRQWDDVQTGFAEMVDAAKMRGSSTSKVSNAIVAYQKFIRETKIDPITKQATEWAVKIVQLMDFVGRFIPAEFTLRQFDYAAIERLCIDIANRPLSKRGNPISPKFVNHALKQIRTWIKWVAKRYRWVKPEDWLEATQQKPKLSADEKSAKARHIERVTYQVAELETLYHYSNPLERAMMLLALNCGFGSMEVATLRRDEIYRDGDRVFIKRIRQKSTIYGEWELWPETVAALAAVKMPNSEFLLCRRDGGCLIQQTPAGRSNKVAAAWARLQLRIEKDDKDFRRLSFGKLRKTSATAIRRIAGGEVASMLLSHGQATADDLLEDYAHRDFVRLFDAQAKYREQLNSLFSTSTLSTRTAMPLSRIDLIRELWATGMKPEEIALKASASRATVYRYRLARLVD